MTTPGRLLTCACILAVGVVGCSDDDDAATTTTTFAIDTPATVEATAPGAGTTVFPTVGTIGPVATDPPSATADVPIAPPATVDIPVVPVDSTDAPLLIDVVVGDNTGPGRVEVVPLGATISLSIVNDAAGDEFHLHGYDLGDGQEFAAGETATFTFTADVAGDFELESHDAAHDGSPILMILRVQ